MGNFHRSLLTCLIKSFYSNQTNFPLVSCIVLYKSWCKKMGKYAFYAVARGRNIGLYSNWTECEMQVGGFKGAKFKGFNSQDDAKR